MADEVSDDEKIRSMLRRAARVGYVRVYPGLERARDEYLMSCVLRGRPCVMVDYGDGDIVITAICPGFNANDYCRVESRARDAGAPPAFVASDPNGLIMEAVHPLQADDIASRLYRIMLQVQKIKQAESTRSMYPKIARFTHAESN